MKAKGKERYDAICRVIEKRKSRGATDFSIIRWLSFLKDDRPIWNALINGLIWRIANES